MEGSRGVDEAQPDPGEEGGGGRDDPNHRSKLDCPVGCYKAIEYFLVVCHIKMIVL